MRTSQYILLIGILCMSVAYVNSSPSENHLTRLGDNIEKQKHSVDTRRHVKYNMRRHMYGNIEKYIRQLQKQIGNDLINVNRNVERHSKRYRQEKSRIKQLSRVFRRHQKYVKHALNNYRRYKSKFSSENKNYHRILKAIRRHRKFIRHEQYYVNKLHNELRYYAKYPHHQQRIRSEIKQLKSHNEQPPS